jgi:hypothetical protein
VVPDRWGLFFEAPFTFARALFSPIHAWRRLSVTGYRCPPYQKTRDRRGSTKPNPKLT